MSITKIIGGLVGGELADHLYCKMTGQSTHWTNNSIGRTCAGIAGTVVGYKLTSAAIRMDTIPVPVIAGGLLLVTGLHKGMTDYGQLPEVV